MLTRNPFPFALLLISVFSGSCARMGAPPGGPEDIEPPRVSMVVPAPDSTGISVNAEVEITFSEKVRKPEAERLIGLSPPAGRLYFKWKANRLRIRPERPLRENMTYRLRVKPGLTDLHRVKNDSSFISYFATGRHFSPGRIEGTVAYRDTLIEEALVFATSLEDSTLVFDSRTDSAGGYFLPYLPYGKYRLRAFRDKNRNAAFDYTREEGADSLVNLIFDPLKINFQLVLGDTTAPFLGSVLTPDSLTAVLTFDDELDSVRGISQAEIVLRTPDSLGQAVVIDSVRIDTTDRRRIILHLAGPLTAGQSYHVRARGILNAAGLAPLPGRDSRGFRYEPARKEDKPGRGRRR